MIVSAGCWWRSTCRNEFGWTYWAWVRRLKCFTNREIYCVDYCKNVCSSSRFGRRLLCWLMGNEWGKVPLLKKVIYYEYLRNDSHVFKYKFGTISLTVSQPASMAENWHLGGPNWPAMDIRYLSYQLEISIKDGISLLPWVVKFPSLRNIHSNEMIPIVEPRLLSAKARYVYGSRSGYFNMHHCCLL